MTIRLSCLTPVQAVDLFIDKSADFDVSEILNLVMATDDDRAYIAKVLPNCHNLLEQLSLSPDDQQ